MKKVRCRSCGSELDFPTQYCLSCGERNVDLCLVYMGEKLYLLFFAVRSDIPDILVDMESFRLYPERESLRNTFELVSERIHWRRADKVVVAGVDNFRAELCAELISKYRLSEFKVQKAGAVEFDRIVKSIKDSLKVEKSLRKVDLRPDEKIGGAHTTVIGGREGHRLLQEIAKCSYVKKIVPGVIEGRGASSGGGVRLKLTRSDDRGNIRAILIDGTSVQNVLVITTASSREEGEFVRLLLLEHLKAK